MTSAVLVVVILLGVTLSVSPVRGGGETFLNHRIVDVTIKNKDEGLYLINLEAVGNMGLDIWLYPTLERAARLRVPPESIDLFMNLMRKAGINAKVMHNNLQKLDADIEALPRSPANYNDFIEGILRYDEYHRMSVIDNALNGFVGLGGATKGYLASQTTEGRNVPYLEITGGTGSNKRRIFIEAGIHAREWISPASSLYLIDRMLHRRSVDADASYLYNNFDWYIVPVTNPDGYEYTHTTSRYWRKNRSSTPGCGSSRGVDLNRNFDSMWGGSGSSGSCSSDTYRGPSVWSEVETSNIRDKVQEIQQNHGPIDAYLSIHSYSQYLIVPYGYAVDTYPPNNDKIREIANAAKDAIKASSDKDYIVGSSTEILYPVDGGSRDWARLNEDILFAVTFELRPGPNQGLNGFNLPTSEIAPCSKEMWDAIHAIASNLPAE